MAGEIIIAGGGARGLYFTQMLTKSLGRKVAAIAENNLEAHKTISCRLQEFNTPQTKLFASVDEALSQIPRSQADIIFVMTPEWTHREVFAKAVAAGCHVFLEKPIATTKSDALKIFAIASKTEKTIQVGFVLRYSAFYRKIKEIIDAGALGRLVMIQMNERLALTHGAIFCRSWHRKVKYTGGMLNEKCCHDLDLMLWFKEGQGSAVQVYSSGGRHFTPAKETPEHCSQCNLEKCPWRFKDFGTLNRIHGQEFKDPSWSKFDKCVFHSDADIMDHQSVTIKFSDGTQGLFTVAAMSAAPGRDIRIFGTDGYLEGSLETGDLRVRNYWEDAELKTIPLQQTDGHGGGDTHIVAGFLKSVEEHGKPLTTVEAGARASLLALAADRSVAAGRPIPFAESDLKH